jgi:hypothetical protein
MRSAAQGYPREVLGVDKPAGIDYDSIKSDAKVLKDN